MTDPARDTRRWAQTAKDAGLRFERHPSAALPWVLVCVLLLVVIGLARGAECPTWDKCWQMELACEATPARNWKPCRKVVRACFSRWERC